MYGTVNPKIEFRGKPYEDCYSYYDGELLFKKDEYVYGSLVQSENQSWIVGNVVDWHQDGLVFEYWCEVRPETVEWM